MKLNKYIDNYFLFLFSIIPISILIGSSVSILNILLIDISFVALMFFIGDFSFLKAKELKYFLILYVYLIFNSFISIDFSQGVYRNFGFLRMIILFFAFNYFFNQKNFLNKVFKFWMIVFAIVLIDVVFESYFGKNILGYGKTFGSRIVSFFKDEPIVGGFLNGFYLMIIGFLIQKFKNQNIYVILFSIFFLLVIVLTGERSNSIRALMGLLMFIIFYNEFKNKIKLIYLAIIIALLSLFIFNSSFLYGRFIKQINSLLNHSKAHNSYYQLYGSGLRVFEDYKIFGVGNKNYRIETCRELDKTEIDKIEKYFCSNHPHQVYVEFLSEHGIFGTFIFFFIMYKLIFSKIKRTFIEKNYLKSGSLIYIILVFTPMLPSGAFFNDYMITIFTINLSIFYASDQNLNIFRKH